MEVYGSYTSHGKIHKVIIDSESFENLVSTEMMQLEVSDIVDLERNIESSLILKKGFVVCLIVKL